MPKQLHRNKVIVRADGGSEIGIGHWSRCLFLLSCVEPDFEKHIFVKDRSGFHSINDQEGIHLHVIESDADFINQVTEKDTVLVDSYYLTAESFRQLQYSGAIVIYIDDLLRKDIYADIIINHSIGAKPSDYSAEASIMLLLGGKYSLISDIFKPALKFEAFRKNNVFISMGGADPSNFTLKLLKDQLVFFLSFDQVHVVVGKQYKYLEELQEFCAKQKKINVYSGLQKSKICELMQACGTAIMSASTMAIEYAHVGGTLGLVETAENQKYLYSGMLSHGLAYSFQQLLTEVTDDQKENVYKLILQKQKETFDGLSKSRFKKLFRDLQLQVSISLRKATEQDLELTYQWAIDKQIRKYSFSKDTITFENHSSWFNSKIFSSNCLYLIAEIDELPIGSIRFDFSNNEALISYLVDNSCQGKGLGKMILFNGLRTLKRENARVEKVVGLVMPGNTASVKIFEGLSFIKDISEHLQEIDCIKYWKKIK